MKSKQHSTCTRDHSSINNCTHAKLYSRTKKTECISSYTSCKSSTEKKIMNKALGNVCKIKKIPNSKEKTGETQSNKRSYFLPTSFVGSKFFLTSPLNKKGSCGIIAKDDLLKYKSPLNKKISTRRPVLQLANQTISQ